MTAGSKVSKCPACGQLNRLRAAAPGAPHCGKCQAALPWLVDISAADFSTGVEQSSLPVLVDFWAPWCGPCRVIAPSVEKMAAEFAGKVKVAKVNTDENPSLGARFDVQGIPTLILFDRSRPLDRVTGALQLPALRQWLEAGLSRSGSRAG
jgi:thioredoxin 2